MADGGSHLGGGGRALELVDRGQHSHRPKARAQKLRAALCWKADPLGSIWRMAVTVRIPTTLRPMAGGSSQVQVEGATLADVIDNLDAAHPGFRDRLLDEAGALRKFVNIFVADDDVRYLDGLATAVPAGETVSIIPAVAGGC